ILAPVRALVLPVITVDALSIVSALLALDRVLKVAAGRIGLAVDRDVVATAPRERLVLRHAGHRYGDRVAVGIRHARDIHGHELVVRGPDIVGMSNVPVTLGSLDPVVMH